MAAHGLQQRFDHFHGKGAFVRLRSMLNDPRFAYQHIANKFGFTRQYTAQLAKGLGVYGTRRRRQRERVLHRQFRVIKVEYPPSIRAVIIKIRRSGNQVTPYVFPIQPSAPDRARKSQTMVVVSGSLCTIQFRKGRKLRPKGREYARFDTSVRTKRGNLLYGQ
jgi:hypothetical protein